MATANPNNCPRCGSWNTGSSIGFNPQRINNDETLVSDCIFVCFDCKCEWKAIGFRLIASSAVGPPSEEAQEILLEAIKSAGQLRIEILDDDLAS
jgi:hypothetical protein